MSDPVLLEQIMVAAGMGLLGAVVFAAIGLVSGTDETTTLAPLTLLVVLLGVPPAGVFTFFLAGAVAKHMTHAVPTALLGIPGDTLATPLLQDANMLRKLGVPHIALRKMVSGAIVAAFVAVPLAVLFAVLLAPFGAAITKSAPWIFLEMCIRDRANGPRDGGGLGLVIVHRILQLHHSDIRLVERPEPGAVFEFDLPTAPYATARHPAWRWRGAVAPATPDRIRPPSASCR